VILCCGFLFALIIVFVEANKDACLDAPLHDEKFIVRIVRLQWMNQVASTFGIGIPLHVWCCCINDMFL